jgi:bifunctional UDP-N-acetylglucosamine pyrophosphorylase/glucosamine-1-phosphate N-acetyltransferase
MSKPLAVVILAAGQGKRMGNPDRAKVLAPLLERPLLGYVLEQAEALSPDTIVVIVGHQREAVRAFVAQAAPQVQCAVQEQQLGTGHAVMQTSPFVTKENTDVLILSGDVPLLRSSTLEAFAEHHRSSGAVASVLTARVPDPSGYGRIVRDADGSLTSIIEHKDASEELRTIDEINSGIYLVDSGALFSALELVGNSNAQGEYYLTDIVGILRARGERIAAWQAPSWEELHGINTMADLERAAEILQGRNS